MEHQVLFNIILGVAAFLGGFFIHVIWEELKELRKEDMKIAEKVASIEVLVAGNYITREEFAHNLNLMFTKLDSIADKIDRKADK